MEAKPRTGKMPFRFQIEAVREIHRDPEGHYHHWTILGGRLQEGCMQMYDYILVPSNTDIPWVATILEFAVDWRIWEQSVLDVGPERLSEVVIWHPVPKETEVQLGIAMECPPETYLNVVVARWEQDRTQFFCRDCIPSFEKTPETEDLLQALSKHSDAELAQLAQKALYTKELHSTSSVEKRKRPWWKIWE